MKIRIISPERQREIYQNIEEISSSRLSFHVMVILSTTIAAYGLMANSTAVVIGAMLVAPLMGPIFGIGLGMATGDRLLLRKSLVSEFLGVLVALIVGLLIGLLPLRLEFGSEIIARTEPTLIDIIVALVSGLAGAYALVDEKISPALPGVAIATALVPPLAACSLCMAAARYEMAFGAFMLFFANFLAIELAATAVFTFFRMSESKPHEPYTFFRFLKRFGITLIALAIVGTFMTERLITLINDQRLNRRISTLLTAELKARPGAQVDRVAMKRRGAILDITATVITPKPLQPSQVELFEEALRRKVDPRVSLVVRSLISMDADRNGIVFLDDSEREHLAEKSLQSQIMISASRTLKESLLNISGAILNDLEIDMKKPVLTIIATVGTPLTIYPNQVREMEKNLTSVLGSPVHLVVKSLLSRDVDSERFLYQEKEQLKPLSGKELAFYQSLWKGLTLQLNNNVKGANLIELRHTKKGGRLLVLAVVRTPVNISSASVMKIEKNLKKTIKSDVRLIVRSVVGTDSSSSGYVNNFNEADLIPGKNNNSGSADDDSAHQ